MKTANYNDVLYLASELGGRTRDKLPIQEAIALWGFVAADLSDVWNKAQWPDLVPAPVAVAPDGTRGFSRNEGNGATGNPQEIGDVLGIYTADPSQTTRFRALDWEEQDNRIVIAESLAQVFIEYLLPMTDLLAVGTAGGAAPGGQAWQNNLAAATVPLRFKNYLAYRGAGLLLNADIAGSGNGWLSLAETMMVNELNRVTVPWWRRGARVRHSGIGCVNASNS